ncbi:MAG: DNA cytosine methyltransferase [Pseudomonadota bacterium]
MRSEVIVDLFAGGGGASEGIRIALGRDPDVAINHDQWAIAMHRANHPGTRHLIEDIWSVPPKWATGYRPVALLWASPDCKHFSKAKGSAPARSREVRSLAWVVERWAREVHPKVIILENVEEFLGWGPLDADGRVIVKHKGDTFRAFVRRLRRLGYTVEHRELRACDYGAPTIRKRLFMVARCDGAPIVWPEPTYGPGLLPYRTAAEIIDWSIPCPSIFERKRPLAENTLRRIAEGIRRYVIESAEPFIVTYYGEKKPGEFRGSGMGDPVATQTTENRHGLVVPVMAPLTHHGRGRAYAAHEPMRTVTAAHRGEAALIATHIQRQFGQGIGSAADQPVGAITAGGMGKAALVAAFLAQHNGGYCTTPARPMTAPVSTVSSRGSQQQLVAAHLTKYFGASTGQPANDPVHTLTGKCKHGIATSHLVKLRGSCRDGQPVTDPAPTVTAGGTHIGEVRAFLMKYYSTGGQWQAVDSPAHTVTTKGRLGLVTVMVRGEPYVITDIGMRMLQPRELFRAQGFSDAYRIDVDIDGRRITKTNQVRCCGNSVCPPIAEAIVSANMPSRMRQAVGA